MKTVQATIEVLDTEISVQVDDDATEDEIEEAIMEEAKGELNIIGWEKEDE